MDVILLSNHLPSKGYKTLGDAAKNLKNHIEAYLLDKKQQEQLVPCCAPAIGFAELMYIWNTGFHTGQNKYNRCYSNDIILHNRMAHSDILYSSCFKESIKVAFALGYLRCTIGYDKLPNQLLRDNHNQYCSFLSINEQTGLIEDDFTLKLFKSLESGIKVHQLEDGKIVYSLESFGTEPLLVSQQHKFLPFYYTYKSSILPKNKLKGIDKYLRSLIKLNRDDTLVYNDQQGIISEIVRPNKDLKINCMKKFLEELF